MEGIRLFTEGQYFLAHEVLEEHWAEAPPGERDFYQGLIHLAVGFHHLERGNRKGALLQFGKSRRRLEAGGAGHGLETGPLLAYLDRAAAAVEAGEEVAPPPLHVD